MGKNDGKPPKPKKVYGGNDRANMKNGKPIFQTGPRNCGTRGNGSQPGAGTSRR